MGHVVHIFCDESGGFERGIFIVCSACIEPRDASHIIGDMRKKFRIRDEIKGSSLSSEQRSHFFEFLENKSDATSIIVSFTRSDPISGWGINNLGQHKVYENMLFESCSAHDFTSTAKANISPDGGKYSKKIMADIEIELQGRFTSSISPDIKVKFTESQSSHGIQVADIVASTVFRALNTGIENLATDPFCGRLIEQKRLRVQMLNLAGIAPEWLSQVT